MTNPYSKPHLDQRLDEVMSDLSRALDANLAAPPTPPPAVPTGPAPAANWGPYSPRSTSPLQLLTTVAHEAHQLSTEINALALAITGEHTTPKLWATPPLPASLLPAISHLAHDLEQVHADIARTIAALRDRL